jgi:hypothetical protein
MAMETAARIAVEEAFVHRIMARRGTFYRSKEDTKKKASSGSRRDCHEIRLKGSLLREECFEKSGAGWAGSDFWIRVKS